jgi:hypothetical protein
MAHTATSLTITVNERTIEGKKKRNRCTIAPTSGDTYPSAGIPLPTHGQFGMVRQLDYILVYEAATSASDVFLWQFSASDGSQGTLRAFGSATLGTAPVEFTELATTATITTGWQWLVEAVGW